MSEDSEDMERWQEYVRWRQKQERRQSHWRSSSMDTGEKLFYVGFALICSVVLFIPTFLCVAIFGTWGCKGPIYVIMWAMYVFAAIGVMVIGLRITKSMQRH
jgi:cobalamin biosynthesis protein CobD/CbiB